MLDSNIRNLDDEVGWYLAAGLKTGEPGAGMGFFLDAMYGSPVRKVAELIEQATREQEDVLDDPAPKILFEDFGDSALIFDVFFFTLLRPGGDLRRLPSEIRFRSIIEERKICPGRDRQECGADH